MWLAMWKSLIRYKEDKSVWSSNYKDFLYRDDKKNMIKNKTFDNKDYKKYDVAWPTHPERTPGKKKVRVEMKKGAVLHYQFSNWESFQLKQCWYRCSELIQNDGKNHEEINKKYKITLENDNSLNKLKNIINTKKLPEEFYEKVNVPDLDKIYLQSSWRLNQINEWFLEFGKEYFSKLDIWHVNNIKQL